MEDKEDTEESPQRIVHVHKHQSKPLFEIGGYKITSDLIMSAVTGVSAAVALGLLFNEVNRRKADQQNADTLQQMQERINALTELPNVELPTPSTGTEEQLPVVAEQVSDLNTTGRFTDNSNYFDSINQGDISSSSNVNLNTIHPFMDNVSDIAEAKAAQHEIYNRQRRYYDYNIPSNPWKTQHIITGNQDSDVEMENTTLPSAGPNSVPANNQRANSVRQSPSAGSRNMYVEPNGMVRRVQPRREIAINLA